MSQEHRISDQNLVTVRELYALIDSVKKDVVSSVGRIETKFDNLESGRLSSLESIVANIQGKMMITPVIISIAIGIFTLIINIVLRLK